jgi:glycosyltransferase involved in cell wall biosynthesis
MVKGVSIIICCFNSENRIIPTLEHLKKQVCPETILWEVIVVDNASTDNTAQVSMGFWGNYPIPFKVIKEEKAGLSFAREAGYQNAAYEYVCLVDDDNWVNPLWVKTIYNIMDNNPNVGACGGRGEGVFESTPPWWFEKFQYAYAVGPQKSITSGYPSFTPFLYGAGLTIRKSLLEKLKSSGFNSLLSDRKGTSLTSGGDFELTLAIQLAGYDLFYDENLTFKHYMTPGRLKWDYLERL